jgi:poly-gamma-glutamate capsule biosynthesis protein CapA/YwtB (metallophosphatase superfamily)
LESVTNGTNVYSYQKVLIFNALPELIKTLPGVWFRILSLANNHALDQGDAGLKTTQDLLWEIGITQVGTGIDKNEAWEPKIIEKNGIKMAFIGASYSSYNDDGSKTSPFIANVWLLPSKKRRNWVI